MAASSLEKTYVGVHPGIWGDRGALLLMCPGVDLSCGSFTVGTYPSGPGGAAEADEEGGHPGLPLTAVLPDAAIKLWTTAAAAEALSSTG